MVAAIHADERVMASHRGVLLSEENHEWMESNIEQWERCGFGLWVFLGDNGELVGRGGCWRSTCSTARRWNSITRWLHAAGGHRDGDGGTWARLRIPARGIDHRLHTRRECLVTRRDDQGRNDLRAVLQAARNCGRTLPAAEEKGRGQRPAESAHLVGDQSLPAAGDGAAITYHSFKVTEQREGQRRIRLLGPFAQYAPQSITQLQQRGRPVGTQVGLQRLVHAVDVGAAFVQELGDAGAAVDRVMAGVEAGGRDAQQPVDGADVAVDETVGWGEGRAAIGVEDGVEEGGVGDDQALAAGIVDGQVAAGMARRVQDLYLPVSAQTHPLAAAEGDVDRDVAAGRARLFLCCLGGDDTVVLLAGREPVFDEPVDVADHLHIKQVAEEEGARGHVLYGTIAGDVVEVGVRGEDVADAVGFQADMVEVGSQGLGRRGVHARIDQQRLLLADQQVETDEAATEGGFDAMDVGGDLHVTPLRYGNGVNIGSGDLTVPAAAPFFARHGADHHHWARSLRHADVVPHAVRQRGLHGKQAEYLRGQGAA